MNFHQKNKQLFAATIKLLRRKDLTTVEKYNRLFLVTNTLKNHYEHLQNTDKPEPEKWAETEKVFNNCIKVLKIKTERFDFQIFNN